MTETIELFPVKNRWTDDVAFTAEISVTPDMSPGWKLRLAVGWALANSMPCASLNLDGIDFTGYSCPPHSSFEGSSFEGSRFVDSRFVDSRFEDSSFVGSSFEGSSFYDSRFVDSSFEGSRFVGSSFVRSRFVDSSFYDSRFVDSRFVDSRFEDSRFVGSSFEGLPITHQPITLFGLMWCVTITDHHMRIGCQFHTLERWWGFSDALIAKMDPNALEFWHTHKAMLQALCASTSSGVPQTEVLDGVQS